MRWYRLLLKLYPARFREEYASPMEQQFRDDYREAAASGKRVPFSLRALADLATSIPAEVARELAQDLNYSRRVYRGRQFSAALAVLALGLAIGASTGIFSVLNALLLRSLPFSDPARLVEMRHPAVEPMSGRKAFREWHLKSAYLEAAAAFSPSEMNLNGGRDTLRVKVAETSANFFELLGTKPVAGRTFLPLEDVPGRGTVAVISYGLWQQFYGGDPGAVGKTLRLNGKPLQIAGVAPPRFDYPGNTNVWIPTVFDFEVVPKHGAFFFQTIGRLKAGVTSRQAREMFEAEVRRVNPESLNLDEFNRAQISSLQNQLAGTIRQASWVLAGMILLVLLAACANVAQLVLSRVTERKHELAVRAALGASPARLVQQLITEATTLTMAGAGIGLVIAHWASKLIGVVAPAQLESQKYTVLDWRVLGFAVLLAVAMGIVFGVLPALAAGRRLPSRRDAAAGRIRLRLVALQAGLTLTLAAISLSTGRTFLKLLNADLGFRTSNAVTLSVSLQGTKYRTGESQWRYYQTALDRLRSRPEIEAAGAVGYLPLASNAYMAGEVKLDSGVTVEGIVMNGATPDYFRAMGTRFIAGGDFPSTRAVIVNEAFADRAEAGAAIVGRKLISPWSGKPYVIAGVVSTERMAGPGFPGTPTVYWTVEEEPAPTLTFVARTRGNAEKNLAMCRDAVSAIDREVTVFDARTLDQRLAERLARPRFYTTATLFLAALAALLATVGIYGTASYAVAQRTRELGIRMALGASYGRIRSAMMRENLMPIAGGLVLGIAGAIASGRYLQHLVAGAEPLGLLACGMAAVLLLVMAAAIIWRATSRVLAIDPADAVRVE